MKKKALVKKVIEKIKPTFEVQPDLTELLQKKSTVGFSFREYIKRYASESLSINKTMKYLKHFILPVLSLSYLAALYFLKGLTIEHICIVLIAGILYFIGIFSNIINKIWKFSIPLLLLAVIYDSQRYYSNYLRGTIRIKEPYLFDKYFFGIPTSSGVMTPNEWFQLHTSPILDVICGFFYISYIPLFLLVAALFYFWKSRTGTKKMSAEEITRRAPGIMWGWLLLNVLGFSTYYWYPAAPPWYVSIYGLNNPVDLTVTANLAGCARFDQIIGLPIFASFYGKSADVFGAIPSLHIAYPLIASYFAFKLGALRIFCVTFYLIMCFSAVYLNHHYILDILCGSVYALFAGVVSDYILDNFEQQEHIPTP